MPDLAIRIENLSKRYLLGPHVTGRRANATFRDTMVGAVRGAGRRLREVVRRDVRHRNDAVEEFWALQDVSFDVTEGQVLGIIGRNGAGKSTLLKIISRITEPTEGRVSIKGRVSSLLEVGTGFHAELSGRENIFLNGAILGMSRREIREKFEEIVSFAEVERFLDTPVKRYSSGMYVRLAFAVAAHLEPEILIVDEVLAVGDAQFQQKCIGKMGSVARDGRTVLFVSHNIDAVKQMCTHGLLLESGSVRSHGAVDSVVGQYLEGMHASAKSGDDGWQNLEDGPGPRRVTVSQDGQRVDQIKCGFPFTVAVEVEIDESCHNLELGIGFKDEEGRDILRFNNKHLGQTIRWPRSGRTTIEIRVPALNWIHGRSVILGVYFGYVGDRYLELGEVMSLGLVKQFPDSSAEKLDVRVNRIYMDGVRYS